MAKPLNIYSQKKQWKWLLFSLGALFVIASLFFTNTLVLKIEKEERNKVRLWADAIQKKAVLVKYTEELFEKLKTDERWKVEIWAEANRLVAYSDEEEDLTFYLKVISGNRNIPVVVVNNKNEITTAINVDFNTDSVVHFTKELQEKYSDYPPIRLNYYGKYRIYLFYKDSKLITELKDILDDLIESFINEVVINSAASPVIITDSTMMHVVASGNIDTAKIKDKEYLRETLSDMVLQNLPIIIELGDKGRNVIFYKDSYLLTKLRYFPYVQFLVLGFFAIVAYFLFSTSRKAEQNQVWMGMAKETAHQLGTPLSSLYGWGEILKMKGVDKEIIKEIGKDVKRLEVITERFSKIGSPPQLNQENIVKVLHESISYLKTRTSKKINYKINLDETQKVMVSLNIPLFQWVVENLCRNAIDAMNSSGTIQIAILEEENVFNIDFTDDGKGVPKSKRKTIFHPGYSTKKTGWGLGLSLSQRIIHNYHHGKIFVKDSTLNKGTTFRIVLNK